MREIIYTYTINDNKVKSIHDVHYAVLEQALAQVLLHINSYSFEPLQLSYCHVVIADKQRLLRHGSFDYTLLGELKHKVRMINARQEIMASNPGFIWYVTEKPIGYLVTGFETLEDCLKQVLYDFTYSNCRSIHIEYNGVLVATREMMLDYWIHGLGTFDEAKIIYADMLETIEGAK